MKTRITFYEYTPSSGPEPGEVERNILYECWAKIDNVWLKDLELAKSTGTLSDLTITIRDPRSTFIPTNKHYVSINAPNHQDERYNVKHVQPDLQNKQFITIVAGLVEK
ncbi:phage head completion protein [Bacillus cihuensis]|uniref:phage head completion protein n=1 Tax=Bacillus cihuensis TaxID=1208599 RepID=UPI0012685A66|nr:head-tail adaptor protein [Bacillus cihuensis]